MGMLYTSVQLYNTSVALCLICRLKDHGCWHAMHHTAHALRKHLQATTATPPLAQSKPGPDKLAVTSPGYQVSASAVASSCPPAATPVSASASPSLHAMQGMPHAANKGPDGPAFWQKAAEVASSRNSAYTTFEHDSKSVVVKSLGLVG